MRSILFTAAALIMISLMAVACGASPGAAPPNTAEPTDPSLPTSTPIPATEPPPTGAAAPPTETEPMASDSFRDDFEGSLEPGWMWRNENPDNWSISEDGWLTIEAEGPSMLGEGTDIQQVNLLTRPISVEGDVILTTRVKASPDENFEQATLYLIEDADNYAAILVGFCDPCMPSTGGHLIGMEAPKDNQASLESPFIPREPAITEVILRLEYSPEAQFAGGLYAFEEGDWESAFILRDAPAFTMVGLGATNSPGPDGNATPLTAQFDFFEMTGP